MYHYLGVGTLATRGLEEPFVSFPDFCDNHQFHVIYCVSSRLCTLFRRISDSQFTWIHDFWGGLGNLRFLQVQNKYSYTGTKSELILGGISFYRSYLAYIYCTFRI